MSKRFDHSDAFGSLSMEITLETRTRLEKWGNQKKTNDQNIVIANIIIAGDEDVQRKRNMETQKTVFGVFSDSQQADIYPGDPLWQIPNKRGQPGCKDGCPAPFDCRGKAFASFDGRPTYDIKTRDAYRRILQFMGIAKGHMFYSIGAPNNGLASIFSGATHVLNNSKIPIPLFTKCKAIIPHPDMEIRKEEMKKYQKNTRFPCNRLMPLIVPSYNMKQRELISKVVIRIFRAGRPDGEDAMLSLRRLNPELKSSLEQLDFLAIALKQLLLTQAVNSLIVAHRFGLITLNMPRFDGSMASYNSINSVFTQTLDDYLTKKTVPTINGAGGSSAVLTGTPVLSDAQQREVAGQFTWLALKVGLVQDSVKTSDSKFKCSKNLTDAFLQPTLSPYFRNDSNARLFDVRRLLNPSVNIEDLKSMHYNDVDGMYNLSTFHTQLAARNSEAVETDAEANNMLKQYEDSLLIGTSLNHTEAGEYTNMVL